MQVVTTDNECCKHDEHDEQRVDAVVLLRRHPLPRRLRVLGVALAAVEVEPRLELVGALDEAGLAAA